MKALTVRQPHASLIVAGVKPVENRPWTAPPTSDGPFPFRLAIHAAKAHGFLRPWEQRLLIEAGQTRPRLTKADYGAVIGTVRVIGCHHADECDHICPEAGCDDCGDRLGHCGHSASWPAVDADGSAIPCDYPGRQGQACNNLCSAWAEPDAYHWVLADPVPLPEPVPAKGRLGLWEWDAPAAVRT